jgi:2-polyprenyl-3-methyl-5-hydroxy-6-metoxy-1,4-benzoquinol methylase
MDRAHAAGVAGFGANLSDLSRSRTSELRFSKLSRVRKYTFGTLGYVAARDADRRAFNREFGASLLTEASARQSLRALKARLPPGYRDYAPIDFGYGLTTGSIASTDSGTGRWEFFNRGIVAPIVAGKRVLDLGCHNGSLSLMMLRVGAREVVGIERSPTIAELARLNGRILSWRDVRSYPIEIVTGDMRLLLTAPLGPFDVITAFCSLYYLPETDMARIIAKAASLNAVLVLQANDGITNLLASAADLQRLMHENGYTRVDVHHAQDFSRPLLIGTNGGAGRV